MKSCNNHKLKHNQMKPLTPDWVHLIKNQPNKGLNLVYNQFKNPFCNWVKTKGDFSSYDAADIFQSSVTILHQNITLGKVDSLECIKSYLFAIGKNKISEKLRANKKRIKLSNSLKNKPPYILNEDNVQHSDEEKMNSANNALEKLGDPCKTVIRLYYIEEYSLEEIAKIMGYKNKETVKTKKYKCINRLRKLIKEEKH